jgi:hypothetical protein
VFAVVSRSFFCQANQSPGPVLSQASNSKAFADTGATNRPATPADDGLKGPSAIRYHHLLKTFWTGIDGWHDRQLPDGTVVWRSPSGQTYTTKPGSALLIPALSLPTAELPPTARRTKPHRGAMMPKRRRTRAADLLCRIEAERAENERSRARDMTTRCI